MADSELLSIDVVIFEKIRQFSELILSKQLTITEVMSNKWTNASKYLIDILFNNLFSNAIRHNIQRGKIIITLSDNRLTFQNTGALMTLDPGVVFNRFQKGRNSEGYGLGLTIIKNICALYNWHISYSYTDQLHIFQIDF